MLNTIVDTAHVASQSSRGFVLGVQQAINRFQNDGYAVEVQYAHNKYGYSALVIARKV